MSDQPVRPSLPAIRATVDVMASELRKMIPKSFAITFDVLDDTHAILSIGPAAQFETNLRSAYAAALRLSAELRGEIEREGL